MAVKDTAETGKINPSFLRGYCPGAHYHISLLFLKLNDGKVFLDGKQNVNVNVMCSNCKGVCENVKVVFLDLLRRGF